MRITFPIPITPRILEQWYLFLSSEPVIRFAVVVGLIFTILFINKARKDGFKK